MIDWLASLTVRTRIWLVSVLALAVAIPIWALADRTSVAPLPAARAPTPLIPAKFTELTTAIMSPLFNPERSPQRTANPADTSEPETAPVIAVRPQLVGLVAERYGPGVALLRQQNGETGLVRPGDIVDGWQVLAISSKALTIRQGGQTETLQLNFDAPPAGSAPAKTTTTDAPREPGGESPIAASPASQTEP